MCKWTHLGFDIPLLPCQVVPQTSAIQLPRCVPEQFDNLGMVRGDGAMFDGRHDESNVHPRIVVLT